MASYSEMIAQIENLKKQAEKQRKEEYGSVLKTIKNQIAEYGISAEDLGFGGGAPAKKLRPKAGRKAGARGRNPSSGRKVPPRYRDQYGNTWTGRGKQPKWLSSAISSGSSLESFLIPQSTNP